MFGTLGFILFIHLGDFTFSKLWRSFFHFHTFEKVTSNIHFVVIFSLTMRHCLFLLWWIHNGVATGGVKTKIVALSAWLWDKLHVCTPECLGFSMTRFLTFWRHNSAADWCKSRMIYHEANKQYRITSIFIVTTFIIFNDTPRLRDLKAFHCFYPKIILSHSLHTRIPR